MMMEIALRRAEIEYEMCGYLAKYDDGDSIEESREGYEMCGYLAKYDDGDSIEQSRDRV